MSSATFLMSYPGPAWQIRGGENFRSQQRASTNPRAAMKEWLKLCDAISHAGGRILVMPPVNGTPPLTGMIYTANAGALFPALSVSEQASFVASKMSVPHRQAEQTHVMAFMKEAGLASLPSKSVWEGQADIQTLAGNRYLLSWGVRTVKEAVAEVRDRLSPSARVMDVQIRDPFFHGDTCLDALTNRGGDTVLLAHEGALVNRTLPELRTFLGRYAEVVAVDEADALAYACNSLCVNGTVLAPTGLSIGLRATLAQRGFFVEEIELTELFGKGGGGPRCLVNQLVGFVVSDDAPTYKNQRDRLHDLAERYPESVSA